MSAQSISDASQAPIWAGWQSAVINGLYPLRQLLHGSEHSALFLTDLKGRPGANAALKIIPIERVTLAQLSHWKVATGLCHPHLIQLFDAGLCHLGGRQFLFVVTEYAEQTLGEVLGRRALTEHEVRDMLPPILGALTFLHGNGLVLGHLKPTNVLVVDDQLKLAIDGIRCTAAPRVGLGGPSPYDPPEANHAPFSPAADIWGLGATLVEALTQRLPQSAEDAQSAVLPPTVPAALLETVQRCLQYDPAARPSASDLEAHFAAVQAAPAAPAAPVAEVVITPDAPPPVAPTRETPERRGRAVPIIAIVFVILVAVVWMNLRLFRGPSSSLPPPAGAIQSSAQQAPAAPQSTAESPTGPAATLSPVHEQMPDVARSALRTIQGHIRITVLVLVDRSGTVTAAHLKNTGPSAYFAGRAREAARKWRFAPAEVPGARSWLLRFEFTHGGVTVGATPGP